MPQITLYTSKTSPYGHYVEIALREAKAEYTRFEVDLLNKPSWFTEHINRKGENPSSSSNSSPTSSPPPASSPAPTTDLAPVRRAQVRFFIDLVSTKLGPAFSNALLRRGAPGDILAAIDELQPYMPSGEPGDGPFILGGAFSNADAVAAAYFVRVDGCLKRDIGSFPAGEGIATYEILCTSGQYARYRAYLSALVARESVKATFHEELLFAPNNVQYVLSKRAEK
ncbi:hypothetical protein BDN71DRAFT_1593596 [Pleurotus eryngii]|uniref:Glutathione transferase n=1 Tax=Pleurotus eryngii TaxID=5323 RepID=A0A9P5ZKZ5_PLEER|nr:hypothetical protein BDN71DRAFT_1593596 [Pleurotus eryngii]